MPKEYEAKFLNIDVDSIKKTLRKNGAKKIHDPTKYYRVIFKRCEEKGDKPGFVRIRDEGKKITMTTKVFENSKFPQEHEITIGETFEKGLEFLRSIGLEEKSYQETIREKWSHPLAHEITFDIVPGLPVYMEVDCVNETKLHQLIDLLELDKKNMHYGSYDKTFTEYYKIPSTTIIHKTPKLTFQNTTNEIKPKVNKDLFDSIVKLQKSINVKNMDVYFKKYKKYVYKPYFQENDTTSRSKTRTLQKTKRTHRMCNHNKTRKRRK